MLMKYEIRLSSQRTSIKTNEVVYIPGGDGKVKNWLVCILQLRQQMFKNRKAYYESLF